MFESLFDNWITIGDYKLELIKLSDFEDSDYLRSNKHYYFYCGGPIINYSSHDSRFLNFLSNSGKPISHPIQFKRAEFANTIFGFPDGHLFFLSYDGNISITDTQGNIVDEIPSLNNKTILCSHVTSKGYVYIKDDHYLNCYKGLINPSHFSYQLIVDSDPCFVSLINDDPFTTVIVTTNNNIYLSTPNGIVQLKHINEKITNISAPFKGNYIGVICDTTVYFISSDVNDTSDPIILYNVSSPFGWIQNNIFMYSNERTLQLIIPKTNFHITLNVFQILDIFEDIEYVRIYARSGCYILRPVPTSIISLTTDRLSSSIKKLTDSYSLYLKRNIESYNLLQVLKGNVENLVLLLLDAARDCLDIDNQKYLLSLACYGRYSYECKNVKEYTETLRNLRLINTLNSPEYGFALTPDIMINHISDVFSSVMELHYYQLAIELCKIFQFDITNVIEHWSINMFSKFGDSALNTILSRCSKYDTINYYKIGESAKKLSLNFRTIYTIAQRINLPKERIQFMYSFDRESTLNMVLHIFDGDSIITYLMLLDKQERERFVEEYPQFLEQYLSYKKYQIAEEIAQNRTNNRNFQKYKFAKPYSAGSCSLLYSCDHSQFGKSISSLEYSENFFDKKSTFNNILTSHKKLLQIARKYKINVEQFKNVTPRELLIHSIMNKDEKLEKEIVKSFGFSSKIVTYTKLDTFARNKMWNELDEFTRIPNPEVGWDIFASVCLEYNEIDHALKFISLIKDKKRQMEVFVRHGLFSQAAKIARELGLNDLAKDYDKKEKQQLYNNNNKFLWIKTLFYLNKRNY